jgi:hypothetical protein
VEHQSINDKLKVAERNINRLHILRSNSSQLSENMKRPRAQEDIHDSRSESFLKLEPSCTQFSQAIKLNID